MYPDMADLDLEKEAESDTNSECLDKPVDPVVDTDSEGRQDIRRPKLVDWDRVLDRNTHLGSDTCPDWDSRSGHSDKAVGFAVGTDSGGRQDNRKPKLAGWDNQDSWDKGFRRIGEPDSGKDHTPVAGTLGLMGTLVMEDIPVRFRMGKFALDRGHTLVGSSPAKKDIPVWFRRGKSALDKDRTLVGNSRARKDIPVRFGSPDPDNRAVDTPRMDHWD